MSTEPNTRTKIPPAKACEIVGGISKTTLYRLEVAACRYDPKIASGELAIADVPRGFRPYLGRAFPKPVHITANVKFYYLDEIERWIEAQRKAA